ncbi:MAG: roadblock/LC7 domain-containing protein [Thermoplasmata archaeon]
MRKSPLLEPLKKISSNDQIEISCIVKTNGDVSASVGNLDTLELETFGIMSATIFGAASTSNGQLKKKEPRQIVIKSSDGNTIINNMSKDLLLVLRAKPDLDLDNVDKTFGKHINEIKNNIT